MTRVLGIGAGGQAKVLIEILRKRKTYRIVGLTSTDRVQHNSKLCGIPVLGDDSILPDLYRLGIRTAFIAVGSVGDNSGRRSLFLKLLRLKFKILSVIHPSAIVSSDTRLGMGSIIMPSAVINAGTQIGDNVILNTGAIVEHDCVIGDHAHIATGARICGGVHIGEGSHIGAGASIKQGIVIGKNVLVGLGAAVVKNVPDRTIVVGIPARPK